MDGMTIAQAAAAAGVTVHTARYYESAGLVPGVARDSAGRRRYGADAVAWLEYAACLRGLGMPVHSIADYVAAATAADDDVRRAVMRRHLHELEAKRRDLDAYITIIEAKLATAGQTA